MRILPILFNGEMVRAILDGRKTCTRRVVKTKRKDACGFYVTKNADGLFAGVYEYDEDERMLEYPLMPPYRPGDFLYVRETWTEECGKYYYRADYDSDYLDPCETLSGGYPASCRNYPGCDGCMATSTRIHWHPSIHMPREAARIWLRVTDVRLERLQDISAEQVVKEGTTGLTMDLIQKSDELKRHYDRPFAVLWDSTIKKADRHLYGWAANPYVFVIEFERCEKPAEHGYDGKLTKRIHVPASVEIWVD